MNLCKPFRVLLSICCAGSGLSCNDATPEPVDDDGRFTLYSFDGCWGWYESGKKLYDVTIHNGRISDLLPVAAAAKSIKPSSPKCVICPVDGLVALSYVLPDRARGVSEFVTFRFDNADSPGAACYAALKKGTIPGRRIVEEVDDEDIFLLPPLEARAGTLVSCDSPESGK